LYGVCDTGEALILTVELDYIGNGIRDEEMNALLSNMLATLDTIPSFEIDDFPQRSRFIFTNYDPRRNIRARIDTDYQIALDAYREGLRGDALIEAMGGYVRLPAG
jgi:hypothetical protein